MTADLKIQREKISVNGEEFPSLNSAVTENFTLIISENPLDSGIYQAEILEENSSIILVSPELDFDSCMDKIFKMITSLGKLISADAKNNRINLNPLINEHKI